MEETTLPALVGANLRRIRQAAGMTLDATSQAVKLEGLRWTDSRVSAVEHGELSTVADLGTLYALARALTRATGHPVGLLDLLAGGDLVDGVDARQLRAFASGQPVSISDVAPDPVLIARAAIGPRGAIPPELLSDEVLIRVLSETGAAERKIAASLGLTRLELAQVSAKLWGRSLSRQRDLLADEGATPHQRGAIAARLKAEVKEALR